MSKLITEVSEAVERKFIKGDLKMKFYQQTGIESMDEQILLLDNHITDLCVEMENSALSDSQCQILENKIINLTSRKNELYNKRSQLENEKEMLFQELLGQIK